mmetsp:Transcript_31732/g.92191  ORF Transcript_31732/g.92191 Transcript_31732/m.92191 type:complete len:125 (-) Transcript_31732:1163-1537(-)
MLRARTCASGARESFPSSSARAVAPSWLILAARHLWPLGVWRTAHTSRATRFRRGQSAHELPVVHHDFAHALQGMTLNLRFFIVDLQHDQVLRTEILDDASPVGIEANELPKIVARHTHDFIVF